MDDPEVAPEPAAEPEAPQAQEQESLLKNVLVAWKATTDEKKTEARKDIEALVRELMSKVKVGSRNVDRALKERIAEIDKLLSSQVAEIIHSDPFRSRGVL